MDNQEIFKRVQAVCVDQLDVSVEEVTLMTRFDDDLELDRLDRMDLILAWEEDFGFEFSEGVADAMLTLQDVVDYIGSNIG